MNKIKLVGTMAFVLLFTLLISVAVNAIGVSPGKTTIDYTASGSQDIKLNLLNKDNQDIKALVYARGPLKEYIEIEQDIVELSPEQPSKEVTIKINFPEGLQPGTHQTDIVFLSVPDVVLLSLPEDYDGERTSFIGDSGVAVFESKNDGNVVAATVAVVSRISLRVPYPGKYAQAKLFIEASQPNSSTSFIVSILNLGDELIQEASVTIDILGPTNEVIATLRSDSLTIKQKEAAEIPLTWETNVNPGLYAVKAVVYYDGEVATVSDTFSVGNIFVGISNIQVDPFRLGGIARYRLELESKWNKEIDGLYAELQVFDQNQQRMATTRSSPVNIDPLGKATLDVFWDTEGIPEGEYIGKIILYYSGVSSERNFKFYAGLDGIVGDFMTTGRAVSSETPSGPGQQFLYLGVLVLLLINIGWWIYFLKIRGKKNDREL